MISIWHLGTFKDRSYDLVVLTGTILGSKSGSLTTGKLAKKTSLPSIPWLMLQEHQNTLWGWELNWILCFYEKARVCWVRIPIFRTGWLTESLVAFLFIQSLCIILRQAYNGTSPVVIIFELPLHVLRSLGRYHWQTRWRPRWRGPRTDPLAGLHGSRRWGSGRHAPCHPETETQISSQETPWS